ncbi:hypothetical protein BDZ91DRAFT_766061 [Kalaharituber pfeilii]|nr:hypothetical protein BDZ91DRAFT_766061 [Kalaharituber pfeilii]
MNPPKGAPTQTQRARLVLLAMRILSEPSVLLNNPGDGLPLVSRSVTKYGVRRDGVPVPVPTKGSGSGAWSRELALSWSGYVLAVRCTSLGGGVCRRADTAPVGMISPYPATTQLAGNPELVHSGRVNASGRAGGLVCTTVSGGARKGNGAA